MIALGPPLCAETVRNVTATEIREWNVTDVVTNVSSDCCLNCSYSHINVSEKDKMTIMEDICLVLYAWKVGGRPCGETASSFKYETQRRSCNGNNSCTRTVQSPVVVLCTFTLKTP